MRKFRSKDIDKRKTHINSQGDFSYVKSIAYYRVDSYRMIQPWNKGYFASRWDYNENTANSISSEYDGYTTLYTIGDNYE